MKEKQLYRDAKDHLDTNFPHVPYIFDESGDGGRSYLRKRGIKFPDLILLYPTGPFAGGMFEVKKDARSARVNSHNLEQINSLQYFEYLGYACYYAAGRRELLNSIDAYMAMED